MRGTSVSNDYSVELFARRVEVGLGVEGGAAIVTDACQSLLSRPAMYTGR